VRKRIFALSEYGPASFLRPATPSQVREDSTGFSIPTKSAAESRRQAIATFRDLLTMILHHPLTMDEQSATKSEISLIGVKSTRARKVKRSVLSAVF
jgi:hypothetical protein